MLLSMIGSIIIILFDLLIAILGGIAFENQMLTKNGFDMIALISSASFIKNYLKYLFLIPIAISVWIQMNQYSYQIFKQLKNIIRIESNKKSVQSIVIQLVVLTVSGGIAISEPPLFLPLILMGSLTQLFLSFLIPSILYQRLLMLQNESASRESIVNMVVIFIELAFGFMCLLADILTTSQYFSL